LDRASIYGTEADNPQPPSDTGTYGVSAGGACHNPCQNRAEIAPQAPDLADLISDWPTLPEPIKAGILAMVKAAGLPVALCAPTGKAGVGSLFVIFGHLSFRGGGFKRLCQGKTFLWGPACLAWALVPDKDIIPWTVRVTGASDRIFRSGIF
jgi:hypothetical protein